MKPTDPQGRVLSAGAKTYGWLRDAVRAYGTLVAIVQLLPAAIALVAVLVSPTAWLSLTLRRWVLAGALAGTVVGMILLARTARLDDLRRLLAGKRVARAKELAALAWWGLGVALVAGAVLRLHFAVVDVGFVDANRLFLPLFDFYLGGGPLAGLLFNLLAGMLSAVVVAGLVAGGPAALLRWRERRAAHGSLAGEGGPFGELDEAMKALEGAKDTLAVAKAKLLALTIERDELAARLEAGAHGGSLTNGPDRQAPRDPPAAAGRLHR